VNAHPLVWLRVQWPREVRPEAIVHAWRMLGPIAGRPLIIESTGSGGLVSHRIAVPLGHDRIVARELEAAVSGVSVSEVDGLERGEVAEMDLARVLRLNTRRRAIRTDDIAATSTSLLGALSATARGEALIIQWVLGPRLGPIPVATKTTLRHESWPLALIEAVTSPPSPMDREAHRALVDKRKEPGWQAIGRLAVHAATEPRQRQLLRQLVGALRSLEAPGVRITTKPTPATRLMNPTVPWKWNLRLNAMEMAVLSAWPVGNASELPVDVQPSRYLAPPRAVPRTGRVLAESARSGRTRPLALSTQSSLRHLHVLGPTGTGKSTALLNLIVQDLEAGRGVVVIESKGDLISDVMAAMPEKRLRDVIVLDPSDKNRPVGLNPLAPMGRPPELVADQLLSTFHSLYAANWGPRTNDILGAALLTLAHVPGMTLCALPILLTEAGFRRRVVPQAHDPIALGPFWAQFEAWSEAERAAATAPVHNKLRPFLINPRLRAVLGQKDPLFHIRQVFTERKVLLVNLAKGTIGPEAAALLGSLVVAELWQAALGRTAIPASKRHPVFIYVDEFQDYLHLPTDLADALGQARGLGVSLTLAHQHLHQLDPQMRAAVLANARSRLCFQLGSDDARVMAPATGGLVADDFMGLGGFECYLRLLAEDSVQKWCSGRTLPPPVERRAPHVARELSRKQFGRDRAEVDRDVLALLSGLGGTDTSDLTPRKRTPGGPK
jgi:hypothetical protein